MISEHKFSSGYTSFWRNALPLGEAFVRLMNQRLRKFAEPYEFDAPAEKSALLSEASFRLLIAMGDILRAPRSTEQADLLLVPKAIEDAVRYLSLLRGPKLPVERLEAAENHIVITIARRLRQFFRNEEGSERLVTAPRFEGCGFLDSCEGDILAGTLLYEIKNKERKFRLVDLRQVLTYCALNYAKSTHPINGIGFVNARSGEFFKISLTNLARKAAGCSASELLSEIVDFVSTDQISN